MGLIDIILLCCYIPAVVSGIRRGFVAKSVGLIAIVLSVIFSYQFSKALGEWLSKYISVGPEVMSIICFVIIFIATSILLSVAGHLVERLLSALYLGWLNSLLGVFVSCATATIILSVVVLLFSSLNESFEILKQSAIDESVLYGPLRNFALWMMPYFKRLVNIK